ncbi:hypothetical protein EV284_6496 [Streptomyces sp. BK022]|uniref:hypothetical protein n=1 Tax=Streptomyces sp. BK022 TaxID=2512123 RepID=UPI0010293CD8|nr:hypothetical protein [Streptomyces sp. BK022]RZU28330.1 hypothetical protein EV284_6496 [Streptomyces sp. BK022]
MATNTAKKTPETDAEDTPAVRTERTARTPDREVVGPALALGQEPQTVTLAHHLDIEDKSFLPGDEIQVAPAYARHLHNQGFTTRT